jgi:CHASE2 domain-containing sensor protein
MSAAIAAPLCVSVPWFPGGVTLCAVCSAGWFAVCVCAFVWLWSMAPPVPPRVEPVPDAALHKANR